MTFFRKSLSIFTLLVLSSLFGNSQTNQGIVYSQNSSIYLRQGIGFMSKEKSKLSTHLNYMHTSTSMFGYSFLLPNRLSKFGFSLEYSLKREFYKIKGDYYKERTVDTKFTSFKNLFSLGLFRNFKISDKLNLKADISIGQYKNRLEYSNIVYIGSADEIGLYERSKFSLYDVENQSHYLISNTLTLGYQIFNKLSIDASIRINWNNKFSIYEEINLVENTNENGSHQKIYSHSEFNSLTSTTINGYIGLTYTF